ncbi:MAG: hypothetical protein ACERKJ_02835 [Candidatus Dadabacteria bacterium]|jgi:hypothetical protein
MLFEAGDDIFVCNIRDNIRFSDFADAGEGNDTLVLVTETKDDELAKEIMKHYKGQRVSVRM